MRAFGNKVQNVFRAQNGVEVGRGVAVDGGEKHPAVGFGKLGAGADDGRGVGNVFQHFHAAHDIEFVRHFGGQIFHADAAVLHIVHAVRLRVCGGRLQRQFRHIHAQHAFGTAQCHAFAQNAAAAAHIDHGFAR